MSLPLSDIIELLRPSAVAAKAIEGAGHWAVRYSAFGQPSFCVVLEGGCNLAVDGEAPVVLAEGDFVFLPATPGFTMGGFLPAEPVDFDPVERGPVADSSSPPEADRAVRHGDPDGPAEVRLLGGYFTFASPDAAHLVSMLPPLVHVRGHARLAALVGLVSDEARAERAGRELVMDRLVEVLLVEALRAVPEVGCPPGLIPGLADERLARALRLMHREPGHGWTIAELARRATLSRAAFFERFTRVVGTTPMAYLMAWRMAVAKRLMGDTDLGLEAIAERVGYGSASAFSAAFRRTVGMPPGRYAREGGYQRPTSTLA